MSARRNPPAGNQGAQDRLGGGSAPTVARTADIAQPVRPLRAAAHGRPLRAVPPDPMPGDVTALRAETQIAALGVDDWPPYGSPAWLALAPQDPRTYAATLEAAEQHRRSTAERHRMDWLMDNDPVEWWREITADANAYAGRQGHAIAARRTAEEIRVARDRATHRPPHQLRATPGWPPIAIPGQPGRYLTHGQEISA
ncbi:hypothetical protein ACUN3E_05200 [Streptomyces sp. Ju416(a)]|uniref:hypothetical protein n=1 Tax=Streptomyces sp. Ju416(a) TaxID=3446591 RepID=UPI00403DBEDA